MTTVTSTAGKETGYCSYVMKVPSQEPLEASIPLNVYGRWPVRSNDPVGFAIIALDRSSINILVTGPAHDMISQDVEI